MVYTKEDFKRLWEANSCGSGITYDDIADCAKSWGISSHPRTRPIDEITYRVLKAAQTNDAEEYNPNPASKESEGERIKREILELVSIAGNGNQFEEIKDWLEKQGEKLDPDKVIAWLYDQACQGWIEDVEVDIFVNRFKKDFGPQPPVLSNSENTGRDLKGGEQ